MRLERTRLEYNFTLFQFYIFRWNYNLSFPIKELYKNKKWMYQQSTHFSFLNFGTFRFYNSYISKYLNFENTKKAKDEKAKE